MRSRLRAAIFWTAIAVEAFILLPLWERLHPKPRSPS